MAASSRGGHALRSVFRNPSSICSRCANTYPKPTARLYATAAAAATSSAADASPPPPSAAAKAPNAYDIRSGIILARPPLLTRNLHPFENAYFFYQKRLEERLNTSFITDIYFKPDTPRRLDWELKLRERQGTFAKELGVYKGKSSQAWDDELRVGDSLSSREHIVDSLLKDAEARISDDAEVIPPEDVVAVERPPPRETEADEKGDVRRLDRRLDQTLYLVVKGKDGWGFPADVLQSENLHEGAQRVMDQAAGVNMNTWIVGRVPVAHLVTKPTMASDGSVEKKGQKTFFLKGRIMAGQADLKNNQLGYTDFKWLTREELEETLTPEYFRGVRNMMADR